MSEDYNLNNIHTLLLEGFDNSDFRHLLYLPDFKDLDPHIAEGDNDDAKVDKIIKYAQKKLLMEDLLRWAKQKNLPRYQKHKPYGGPDIDTPNVVLNFSSRSLLPEQRQAILEARKWDRLYEFNAFQVIAQDENFEANIIKSIEAIPLNSEEWQTYPILLVPGGYAPLWAIVLAELHGRIGHFPDMVNLRPSSDETAKKFEVGGIVDLQNIRNEAQKKRLG
jgi:hypothetical protein